MDNQNEVCKHLFLDSFYKSFGFRSEVDLNWFDWYYLKNPIGKCNGYFLKDAKNNTIIGSFSFAKIQYYENGRTKTGGLAVNGFISKGYEGKGLYTSLIAAGLEKESENIDCFFSFPHKNNAASIKGHLKSGWKPSINLEFVEILVGSSTKMSVRLDVHDEKTELANIDFSEFDRDSNRCFQEISILLSGVLWKGPIKTTLT